MIPLAIELEGFLSFRDRERLEFGRDTVWLLSGRNGVGKSSVFDAILFALYGAHRAGSDYLNELIHKQRDSALVRFDFELDGKSYRAERSVERKMDQQTGKEGYGSAARLYALAAKPGSDISGGWKPIPGTHKQRGFNDWVHEHIGLSREAFTVSVLLMQGKAEGLVSQDAKAANYRFEVLARVMELDQYERVQKLADKRRRAQEKEATDKTGELRAYPSLQPGEVEAIEQELAIVVSDLNASEAEVQRLSQHKEQARESQERLQQLDGLPNLQRFQDDRERLREALTAARTAKEQEEAAEALALKHESAAAPLRQELARSGAALEDVERALVEAKTNWQSARKSVERFHSVAGEQTCGYCGQPLDANHVEAEQRRREEELASYRRIYDAALAARDLARRDEERLAKQCQEWERLLSEAQRQAEKACLAYGQAQRDSQRYGKDCTRIYRELSPSFRERIATTPPACWSDTTYPTSDDLESLIAEKHRLKVVLDELWPKTNELQVAQRRVGDLQRQHGKLEEKCQALLDRQQKHKELDEQRRQADRQRFLYARLAELLGPKQLQRHLVRQAEQGVVENANHILKKLAGSQLQLQLRRDESDEEEAALQLASYKPLDGQSYNLSFLSGSERFRVAVALALGIGQYASKRHRPIESIIIDEGFGCLDRDNRGEMIDELKRLIQSLRCILLVSHQEEFAEAFPDGHRLEMIHGTTKARSRSEEEANFNEDDDALPVPALA